MRAERLLADLLDEGVQLWAEGEDLCYRTSDDAVIRSRRQELLEHKAEIVALLGPGRRYAVPSFAQQRMWFLAQQEPLSTADNLPVVSRLRGRLEVAALESTFREIVRRHEILRTLFGTFDERPVQVIGPGAREPMLPLVDLGGLVAAAGEAEARHLAVSEAARPFDLAAGPLLRTVLLRLGDDQHLLLMNLHHIHWDGWSQGILDHELATLYQAFSRGEPSPLPELGVQFSDFAVWQREWLSGAAMETQLAYWRAELGGDPPLLRLPTDRPRPAVAAYRGGEVDFELSESLTRALGKLSREAGASLYMTLLAAFMILLARHAGQNVVVVGSPITHRRRRELEGLIGFFVNTVALRGDLTGGPSFRDFLEQIRKRVLDAFAHQDVPFEKLVEELQPARDPGRHPLFQVMFALQDAAVAEWKLPGLTVTQEEPGHQAVRFYLEMHCLERPQGLQGIVNYPVELFDAVTIERMVSRFQSLLAGIAAEPHHRIPELPLLCAADEEELRSQAEADPPAAWWTADGDGGRVAIVPIEPAAAGRRLHLLDERGRPVPAGIVGEVRIAGLEPERIGDLGCRHRDGTLEITGSTDGAIWRRGVRMSPAVTWEALLALPEVADGTILRRHAENGEVELVAYLVPEGRWRPERLAVGLKELLEPGRRHFDAWMPDAWVPIAALPLRADGRVDVAALERLEVVDPPWIDALERRFAALAGVAEVAIVEREPAQPRPLLHLAEVLPDQHDVTEDASAAAGESVPEDAPVDREAPPAIVHGPALEIEPGAPRILAEALERAAGGKPQRGVIYLGAGDEVRRRSYAELVAEAECIVGGLRELGARPGERVLFQLDRNQDFLPAFWACTFAGLVPVPLAVPAAYEAATADARKLAHAWQLLERPRILTTGTLKPRIASLAHELDLPGLECAVIDELRRSAPDPRKHPGRPDELALILLTSGSTGKPKGVMQSHRALLTRSLAGIAAHRVTGGDVSFNWMPLEHVGGLVMLHLQDVVAVVEQVHAPTAGILEDPLRWLDGIERFRASMTWAPNSAFALVNELLEALPDRRWDLGSMRLLYNGGEAIVARTARRFLELLAPHGLPPDALHPAWGMSETSSGTVFSDRFSRASTSDGDRFVELGTPLAGLSLRIVGDDGAVVPEETVGSLEVRGEAVTSGYFAESELNREAFTRDGWLRTGDRGFLRGGRLTLTGREEGIIIIHGVNYAGHELESVVGQVDGVMASYTAACAVKRHDGGPEELAVFFHHPASRATDEELRQVLLGIRHALVERAGVNPDHLLPVDPEAIPKTSIGKIQHKVLSRRFREGAYDGVRRRVELLLGHRNTLPSWFFKRIWRPRRAQPRPLPVHAPGRLLFIDRRGLGERIIAARPEPPTVLVETGTAFADAGREPGGPRRYRVGPANPGDYERLIESLCETDYSCGEILHLWTYDSASPAEIDGPEDLEKARETGIHSLLFLFQALARSPLADADAIDLTVVSSRAQAVSPEAAVDYWKAPAVGLLPALAQQVPWLMPRHVDLAGEDPEEEASLLLTELAALPGEREVAWRDGERLVPRLEHYRPSPSAAPVPGFERGGFYLLSGGRGGIGVEIARFLRQRFAAHLLIVDRTPLPDEAGEAGHHAIVDVADGVGLEALVAERERVWQRPLAGVIHLAGSFHQRLLAEEDRAGLDEVLRPKLAGTWWLYQLLRRRRGGWFLGFSSVVATFGGATLGAYAAANRFLEAFTHHHHQAGDIPSFCFSWSRWEELGMSRGDALPAAAGSRGELALTAGEGLHSLLAAMASGSPQLRIGLDPTHERIRRHLVGADPRRREPVVCWAGEEGVAALARQPLKDRFGTPVALEAVRIPRLPRTAVGEVDREALIAEIAGSPSAADKAVPRTPLEKRLAAIWRELLGVERLGVHDNFFELGGHSLLATRIVSLIRRDLDVEMPQQLLFEAPTIAGLARHLDELRPGGGGEEPRLVPMPRDRELVLSVAQEWRWRSVQRAPADPAHHIATAWHLAGRLDPAALAASFREILRRHEILRTGFPSVGGRPCPTIAPEVDLPLPVVDLSAGEEQVRRLVLREAARPFDLARAPLLRLTLLRRSEQEHLLLIALHRMVADGWSQGILYVEMAHFYKASSRGREEPLPELPIQYADFAVWQRERLGSEAGKTQLRDVAERLAGIPPLRLTADRRRRGARTSRAASYTLELSAALTDSLRQLSLEAGATLYMTLLGAWMTLLHRVTGQEQIAVVSPIANRERHELEGLIGLFVNLLVIDGDLSRNPTFRELLEQIRRTTLDAYARQDLPIEALVEQLQADRDRSEDLPFRTLFALQNLPQGEVELPGLTLSQLELVPPTVQHDLELFLFEAASGLQARVFYSTDLFDAGTIARLMGRFERLLKALVARPESRLLDLPCCSFQEKEFP